MKTKYLIILFIALVLFIGGLNNGSYINNIIAIFLGYIVYSKGDKFLFKQYNERKKKKDEEARKFRQALKEKK